MKQTFIISIAYNVRISVNLSDITVCLKYNMIDGSN